MTTMSAGARARLAASARRYYQAAPWTAVDGDDFTFGIRDPGSGRIGFGAVLGARGAEFGLDLILGEEGYALRRQQVAEEIDIHVLRSRAHMLTMTITLAAPASRAFKRIEPLLVDRKKVDAPTRGYITAWRLDPGHEMRSMTDDDATFFARSLDALAELTRDGRLGADRPTDGPRVLVYELAPDAPDAVSPPRVTYREVAAVDPKQPEVVIPPPLLDRLRNVARIEDRYLLSLYVPPISVMGKTVWMALLVRGGSGTVLLAHIDTSFEAAALAVLRALAGELPLMGGASPGLPRELWSDAVTTTGALGSALTALGIQGVVSGNLPELDGAKASFAASVHR